MSYFAGYSEQCGIDFSILFTITWHDKDKNIEQRQAKERNFFQTSGGRGFMVYDIRSCMRNIRSEINYFLSN